MLWRKKIPEWSRMPKEALKTLIPLNKKYQFGRARPEFLQWNFLVFGPWGRRGRFLEKFAS